MRRIAAARNGETGIQILSLPLMAARLVGGFARQVDQDELDEAIRTALDAGGFEEIQGIRDLPGMTRAVSATLHRLWNASVSPKDFQSQAPRWADLAKLEDRLKRALARGALIPTELCNAAIARAAMAPAVLGPVELWKVPEIAPLWRPLVLELARHTELRWLDPPDCVTRWFTGTITREAEVVEPTKVYETCANPRAEALEALRWGRQLLATGAAKPGEIAICATSTAEWDSHFLVLGRDAGLPIHFSHGFPALASWEGQVCAALADILLHGLSQVRVRRFLGQVAGRADIPKDWAYGLEPGAALRTITHWVHALGRARALRGDDKDIASVLIPWLQVLDQGVQAAPAAAELLPSAARILWRRALQHAPATAIEYSLQALRTPDGSDPGASIVWGPARHLEAAPRAWVRMLGLTSRSWPRTAVEDPLLPAYLIPDGISFESSRVADQRAYQILADGATKGLFLARSRRSVQGTLQASSPLISRDVKPIYLRRSRVPEHALSETDRLLARPTELATQPIATSARQCWRDWNVADLTIHDGLTSPDHPVVTRTLKEPQSATSLRRMLRDPIAFIWRYALGWREPIFEEQPLSLDASDFGELVHALLKETVDAIEPDPGLVHATHDQVRAALNRERARVADTWPLVRAIPPTLLWQYTLDLAVDLAFRALTLDDLQSGTRTWSEVGFGMDALTRSQGRSTPWREDQEVVVPNTAMRIRGSIDRVDLRKEGDFVRVTDYKTGKLPQRPGKVLFGNGAELQRVIYAIAARSLLPGPPKVVARLVYLVGEKPTEYQLKPPEVEAAIDTCIEFLNFAQKAIGRGLTLAGPDAKDELNELKIALPAALEHYLNLKNPDIRRTLGREYIRIWGSP